jgi:ribonuclease HI
MEDILRWLAETARSGGRDSLYRPGGEQLKYALQLLFPASNNTAEYEALIHGLSITVSL